VGAVFGVTALMFAAAAILFALVESDTRHETKATSQAKAPFEEAPRQQPHELAGSERPSEASWGPVAGIVEGIRYAWRDPLLRTMLFALALLSFSTSGPLRVGSVMLAETRFGGVEAFGVLLSAFGAGVLIGLVAAGSLVRTGTAGTGPHSGDGRARLGLWDSRLRLEPAPGGHDRSRDGRWCRLPGRGAHGLAAGANEALCTGA
jgi:hypothetical protein